MKRLSVLVVFPVLIGILCIQSLVAEDLGWLQPGVRVWYVGGAGDGTFSSNAQEADLITKFENGSAYVMQQQALVNWTSPLPSTEWINPSPYSEGVFWIHPQRLKAMKTGDVVPWLGTDRFVKARTSYTASTLPFLKLLPMEELFTLSLTRELVILIPVEGSGGEYYFDVETGLLVSKTESLGGTQTMLSIAEINYAFTNHAAYPEDNGPHAGFAGRFSGSRAELLYNQGFQLDSMVISRHNGILLMTLTGNLMNVLTGQYYAFNNYLCYDYLQNKASIRSHDVEDWQVNGDHLFWWVPPAHLTNAKIWVWDQDLANGGTVSGVTTFSTTVLTQTDFPALSFDVKGYLTDMTVNVPSMQIYIDTRLASTKNMRIDGLQYYLEHMTPAVPQGKARIDFNGDGKEDILWRNSSTGQNVVWYLGGYTASASGAAFVDQVTGSLTRGLAAVDMNQSYASSKVYWDVAEVGGIPGQPVGTMFFDPLSKHGNWDITKGQDRNGANGGQAFSSPEIGPIAQTLGVLSFSYLPAVTDVNWAMVGTGDFNGDGKVDIIWRNSSSGQNLVWYMNGIANAGYSYLSAVTDVNWQIAGTGDFNGDGQIDILWRNYSTGQNIIWYMNGATYTGYVNLLWTTDVNWKIVGTGDFDLDGKVDILWRNSSTGQNIVWYMNGATYVSYAYLSAVTDVNWKIVGTGDFNGDGKVDIIWRNNSTGLNLVWYMNGRTNVSYDYLLTVADSSWKISNH